MNRVNCAYVDRAVLFIVLYINALCIRPISPPGDKKLSHINAPLLFNFILNQSVNVDAKDKEGGYTAVMLAAMNEHEKVM